jgi:hypothetical protein
MSDHDAWPKAIARDSKGEYLLAVAASAWQAWQAAWKAKDAAYVPRIQK